MFKILLLGFAFIFSFISLSGCALQRPTLISANEAIIISDQRPAGFPRTFSEPLRGNPGFCRRVTVDYVQHNGLDRRLWFKSEQFISYQC